MRITLKNICICNKYSTPEMTDIQEDGMTTPEETTFKPKGMRLTKGKFSSHSSPGGNESIPGQPEPTL